MKKLTIESLDSLFNYINKPSTIFWLRDKSYQKQIYISPSFEAVWGIPCASLYEDNSSSVLQSTFIEDDEAESWSKLDEVKSKIGSGGAVDSTVFDKDSEVLLRIKNHKENEKFIIDYSYVLTDEKGENIGFAGIANELTKEEWHEKFYTKKSDFIKQKIDPLKKHIFDLLKKEAGVYLNSDAPVYKDKIAKTENNQLPLYFFKDKNIELVFSQRESECIYYLYQGKSAKQTAFLLNISVRTVEFHLANARQKTHCRSKLELMHKVKMKLK